MPIRETSFTIALKRLYGRRWREVFYRFKARHPSHPAVKKAYYKSKLKKVI